MKKESGRRAKKREKELDGWGAEEKRRSELSTEKGGERGESGVGARKPR